MPMMKRYKLLLALALSLLVFGPLGAIKADTVNQPPESANQSEQISAAVATDSSTQIGRASCRERV